MGGDERARAMALQIAKNCIHVSQVVDDASTWLICQKCAAAAFAQFLQEAMELADKANRFSDYKLRVFNGDVRGALGNSDDWVRLVTLNNEKAANWFVELRQAAQQFRWKYGEKA